jgi:hypothetical protein
MTIGIALSPFRAAIEFVVHARSHDVARGCDSETYDAIGVKRPSTNKELSGLSADGDDGGGESHNSSYWYNLRHGKCLTASYPNLTVSTSVLPHALQSKVRWSWSAP